MYVGMSMNQEIESKIDNSMVDELVLYEANDEPLYRIEEAWVSNYSKKVKKGVFDRELALKGIVNNFVPMIAKKYRQEFGLSIVNKETKTEIGKELLSRILESINFKLGTDLK